MVISIRTTWFRGLLILLFIFAAKTGYAYYRVFAWQPTSATVVSARQTCEYAKKSGRHSYHREYPFCDDGQETVRLMADGYKLRDARRLWIEAVYEDESWDNVTVTFDASQEDAGAIKAGSTIKIRVSSGSAELAIMPDPTWTLLLAVLVAVFGAHAYVTRSKATS